MRKLKSFGQTARRRQQEEETDYDEKLLAKLVQVTKEATRRGEDIGWVEALHRIFAQERRERKRGKN